MSTPSAQDVDMNDAQRIAWKGRDVAALAAADMSAALPNTGLPASLPAALPDAGLSAALPAVIHSVYARACNIQLPDGRLLALLAPALPRIAWGVGLAQLPRPFSSVLRAGMPCHISAAGLRVDAVSFSLCWNDAPLWDADRIQPTGPAAAEALITVHQLAAARGWPGWTPLITFFAEEQYNFAEYHNNFVAKPHQHRGISSSFAASDGALCAENIPSPVPSPAPPIVPPVAPAGIPADDILLQHAAALCQKLVRGWRAQCAAEVCAAACGMVGLGIGLTPSGDDFLGGLLAGLHATATPEQRRQLLRPLCAALHSAAQGTGAVAASFLRHACRNSFSHTVVELAQLLHISCEAAEEASAQALECAAAELLSFGSTSGADTLAGLLFAAQLTEKTA